ncbi:MAG: OsmC family protein [Albidovulum sp.]|nr:OsmC family protein [Albidovulum sp.]
MSDVDLLPPSVYPKRRAIGVRRVGARNEAATRTVMMARDHVLISDEKESNTGPTPLEMCPSSLLGGEGVIINRCAEAMKFSYSAVEMDAGGEVNQRGSRGVPGVRPYFNGVRIRIKVQTDEPPERLEKLRRNVEYRRPVVSLFRAADVALDVSWERAKPWS